MAQKVKVWHDAEGDFIEVAFSDEPGPGAKPSSVLVGESGQPKANCLLSPSAAGHGARS